MGQLKIIKRPRTRLGSKPVSWWKRQPVTRIDPRKVWWPDTPVNEDAVEFYKRNPRGRYCGFWHHDGDPCVVRAADGTLEGRNGKHRAIAAIETRRKLRVRLHDEGGA